MLFFVATPGDARDSDGPQPAAMMDRFVPAGAAIPFTGQSCNGIRIVLKDRRSLDSAGLGVEIL
ncbi:MAG: hypothetical protein HY895_09955 [Deltaproteobacteria bacterium]|nr:hypothetical protein [Deltaproteobacteria bacterium]